MRAGQRWSPWLFPAAVAVAFACGSQVKTERVSAAVGPTGGTLAAPSGATVVVPSGAVATTVTLTAEIATAAAAPADVDTVGDTLVLGPEGQQFAVPVVVTLTVDPARLPAGTSLADVVIYSAPVGSETYENLGGAPSGSSQVEATTTHFSKFVPCVRRHSDAGSGGGAGGGSGGSAGGGSGGGNSGTDGGSGGGGSSGTDGGSGGGGGSSGTDGGSGGGGGSSGTDGGSGGGGGSSGTDGGSGGGGGSSGTDGGSGGGGGSSGTDGGSSDGGAVTCVFQQFATTTTCNLMFAGACAGEVAQCEKDGGVCTCIRDGGAPTIWASGVNICANPFQYTAAVQAGCGFP